MRKTLGIPAGPGPTRVFGGSHPSLGMTVFVMTALTLTSQILALGRESVIAARFGASHLTDAFLLAVMIPNAILLLIQSGIGLAFIPVLAEVLATRGEEQARAVGRRLITRTLLALGGLALLIVVGAPRIVGWLAPDFPPELRITTIRMMRLLAGVSLFGGLASLLGAVLNASRRYFAPALFGIVLNVTVISGTLLLAGRLSIYALAGATVAAYLVQTVVLAAALRGRWQYGLEIGRGDHDVRRILRIARPVALTLFCQQVILFADRTIALRLGEGSVSALNFAAKLVLIIVPLVSGALATISLPELSRLIAGSDLARAERFCVSVLRHTFFIALPLAAGLFVLRRPVTVLAFERGVFTRAATEQTVRVMAFLAVTVVMLSARELLTRYFYASNAPSVPLFSAALRMTVNVGLDLALAPVLGIGGIALAGAAAATLDAGIMLAIWLKRWRIPTRGLFVLKTAGAVAALLAASLAVRGALEGAPLPFPAWSRHALTILGAGLGGGFAFFATALLLRIPEARRLFDRGLRLATGRREFGAQDMKDSILP